MKKKIFLIVLSVATLRLFAVNPAWAQYNNLPVAATRAINIQGAFTRQSGFRCKWQTAQIDSNFMTKFSYLKNPKIVLYLPDQTRPIKIVSDKLKADAIEQDLIFEGHVVIETPNGILRTPFLNFNAKRSEIRSFDQFTYQTKQKTYRGRGLHGLTDKRTITLFNTTSGSRNKNAISVQI